MNFNNIKKNAISTQLINIIFYYFRNNEKRKEKSRDAARCRRSRETEIFSDLASALPVRRDDIEQLDKASIMRLSIAYLKVRNMFDLCKSFETCMHIFRIIQLIWTKIYFFLHFIVPQLQNDLPILEDSKDDIDEESNVENFVMQALDGFMFVLSGDGDVTYVSENVSEYLGIQQVLIWKQKNRKTSFINIFHS